MTGEEKEAAGLEEGGGETERGGCWATTPLSRHEHCSTKTHLGLDERVVRIMLERKCPKIS